jgi:3-hydroxybutyryl-CoA dehydrogenase
VTPREVDLSVIHGLALRLPVLGHLAKADFSGLGLVQQSMANRKTSSPTVDRLMAAGRTGVMAGRGFFDWGGRSPDELFRERDRRLIALKQAMRKMGGPLEGT